MMDNKGRVVCDAEVGSVQKGWNTCGRRAVVQSRTRRYGVYLDWCENHRGKASESGRTLVREYIGRGQST